MTARVPFKYLGALLLLSFGLIGYSQHKALNQVQGMLLSCSPLLIYHWFVLARRKHGSLNQAEIDSVYYFGFLITIASLAAGVFFFRQSGAEPDAKAVGTLLRQFAVGIAATAYAVFARMHLASRSATDELDDPQGLLNAQVLQVKDILHQMTSASIAAQTLTTSIEAARDQLVTRTTKQMADALADVSRQFSAHLGESLSSLNAISEQVRTTLSAVNDLTVEQGIPKALRELSSASKSLSDNTLSAASASLEAATAIGMVGQEFREMQGVIATGRASLGALEDIATALKAFDSATASAADAVRGSADEIVRVTTELRDVGDAVSTAPRTMKRLADQIGRTAEGMNFLVGVAGKLDAATDGLGRAAASTESLVAGLGGLARVAPELTTGFQQLNSDTEEYSRNMAALATAVLSASTAVSKLEAMAGKIDSGNAGLAQLAAESQELSAGLALLSAQIARSERELAGATGQMAAATSGAAASLQRDLEAATGSAAEVSRRLVTLVNSIVEQTNRQQVSR